jgi:hypothetical protein
MLEYLIKLKGPGMKISAPSFLHVRPQSLSGWATYELEKIYFYAFDACF